MHYLTMNLPTLQTNPNISIKWVTFSPDHEKFQDYDLSNIAVIIELGSVLLESVYFML